MYNHTNLLYLYYDGYLLLEDVKQLDVGGNAGGISAMGVWGQAVDEGYHNSFDIDTFLELSTGLNHKEVPASISISGCDTEGGTHWDLPPLPPEKVLPHVVQWTH